MIYDGVRVLSNDDRNGKHPSTQKFGRFIILCHRDNSLPVESIQSAGLRLNLPEI